MEQLILSQTISSTSSSRSYNNDGDDNWYSIGAILASTSPSFKNPCSNGMPVPLYRHCQVYYCSLSKGNFSIMFINLNIQVVTELYSPAKDNFPSTDARWNVDANGIWQIRPFVCNIFSPCSCNVDVDGHNDTLPPIFVHVLRCQEMFLADTRWDIVS